MKHTFTKEVGKTTYCGSHYCDGHKNEYIVCSCGWRMKDYWGFNKNAERENAKMKHILQYEGFME